MLFFFSFLIHRIFSESHIQFRPEESFKSSNEWPVGFFDLQYTYNGQEIPFSKNNNGTEVKLIVDGQNFYPSKMNTGTYKDLIVIPDLDKLTENDIFVNFIVRNTGTEPRTFSLGAFTHINFLNTVNSAKKFINNGRSFYFYTSQSPTWRKLSFDHNSQLNERYTVTRDYTPPSYSWYGHIQLGDDKYFMKFNSDSDMTDFSNPDGAQTSYSWKDITLQPEQQVILGTHITFLMKSEFQIIPESNLYAVKTGTAAECMTYLKGLTPGIRYKPMSKLVGSDQWILNQNMDFSAGKSNDRWGYKQFDTSNTGRYQYDIKLVNANGQDSNIERITFTVSTPPTLSLESGADISTTYKDTETIPLTLAIGGDSRITVRFSLFSGTYQIKQTEETVELDTTKTSETKTFHYSLKNLRSGRYTLKIICLNDYGLKSDEKTTDFKMDYQTYIASASFDKTVYYPGEIITAKGQVQETDEHQTITFHVKLSDSVADLNTTKYTPTGKMDDFSVTCKAPSTLGLLNFDIYATYDDNVPFFTQTFQLRITDKPNLTYTQITPGKVFMYNETIIFDLNLNDESNGTIYFSIDNQTFSESYSTSNNNFIYHLNINFQQRNIVYSKTNHLLTIYAQDEFGVQSNSINFPFTVLTPSNLKSIEIPDRIEPNTDTKMTVHFDDHDNTKKLYFYAQINDEITEQLYETTSNGGDRQSFDCNINLQSGNYNIKFFLSTRYDSSMAISTNSESNPITKSIISTKVPQIQINWPEIMKFGSQENIRIELTAIDENSGAIHYYIDNIEQYLNDNDVLKRYTNKTINQEILLPIPDTFKFGSHQMMIKLIDDFNQESQPAQKEFYIINKPLIKNLIIEPKKFIYSGSPLTAKVAAQCYNADENRGLAFYWKVGENGEFTKLIDSFVKIGDFTLEQNVEITQTSGKDLSLIFYLYDETNRDSKNAISEGYTEKINITRIPEISSDCPLMKSFGINETVNLEMKIIDDTNGRIKFFLNDDDLGQDYLYNTTNGISNFSAPVNLPNNLTRGKFNISYYPIDEFGYKSNDEIRCELLFKNKPKLSNLKLSKSRADNDDKIYVYGYLIDYDFNKTIYIYQKIGNQQPKVIGNLTSQGGSSQYFRMYLEDMVYLKSGNTSIDIIASDNEKTIYNLDSHATSDPYRLYIDMVNNPDIFVEFPADQFYSPGEEFDIIINVTADLQGQIKIYEVVSGMWGNIEATEIATITYTKSDVYTHHYKCINEIKDYQIAVQAEGPKLSNSMRFTKDISCRKAPILNRVSLNRKVVEPGSSFTINYDFKIERSESSEEFFFDEPRETYIYLFAKYNDKILRADYVYSPYYMLVYNLKVSVDLSSPSGQSDVLCWVQYTPDYVNPPVKLSKSNEETIAVTVTRKPEVDFNFDDDSFFGYNDKYKGNVVVNDDSKGRVVVELKNSQVTKTVFDSEYNSYNKEKQVDFSFDIDREIKYGLTNYVKITVTDEYGMSVSEQREITIINKPVITFSNFTPDYALQGDYIYADVNFTDYDQNKPIYFYYTLNDVTKKVEQSKVSNGEANQHIQLRIFIPLDTESKLQTIDLKLSNLESQTLETNRNSYSESRSYPLEVTYRPTITVNKINQLYSKGQKILLKGQISGNQLVNVVMLIDDVPQKPYKILTKGKELIDYEYNLVLPNDIKFGTRILKVKAVDSKGVESTNTEKLQFVYKNKPVIARVDNIKEYYDTYGDLTFNVYVNDTDKNKELYIHGQIGNDYPYLLSYGQGSTGGDNQLFEINQYFDTYLSGEQNFKVWVSDSFDPTHESDIDNSEVYETKIVLKYTPSLDVTFTPSDYYIAMNSSLDIRYTHYEEEKVTMKIIIGQKEILSEEINTKSGRKSVQITDDIGYGQKHVSVYIINKYKFESTYQETDIYVTSPSVLHNCSFTRNFALPNELIEIEGSFDDFEKNKYLYVFLKLGDREVKSASHKIQSSGEYNQKFQFGITIPKDEIIGIKSVTFWMSSNSNPQSSNAVFDSKKINGNLLISFKPSLEIKPLSKTVYDDGDKITLSGSVNAHTNVVLNYRIDSIILEQETPVTIQEYSGIFSVNLEIPSAYKYSKHVLYVQAIDGNGQTTGFTTINFEIENPPKILSVSLEKDVVKVDQKLVVKGTVQDKDLGNEIRILYRFDKGEETNAYKLQSDGSVQEFTFSIVINLEVGEHTIEIIASDNDGTESATASLKFTVEKIDETVENTNTTENNNNANSNTSSKSGKKNAGLIAGVVIAALILVALLVVASVLLIKRKQTTQNNNSGSEGSDIQEFETNISRNNNFTIEEIATNDNPLFSSTPLGNETDPFSDEFEEQEP